MSPSDLLGRLADLPPIWVYAIAGLVIAAEVGLLVGIVLPAASTMLVLGFLSHTGQLSLPVAVAVATVAALVGDNLGYLEGRLVGPRVRQGRIGRWIGRRRWRRFEHAVLRGGGPAVTIGRWTAFARTLVPRVAGAADMPYQRFVVFNSLGVIVWVPGSVVLGYVAGASYTRIADATGVVGLAVAGAAVLATGVVWALRRRGGRRRSAGAAVRSGLAGHTGHSGASGHRPASRYPLAYNANGSA